MRSSKGSTTGTNLFNITDGTSTRFSVDSFSGATTISSGTLTAAEELLNISSTWNNAGSTFYGIKFDVTNTASGANSRLIDLGVGGSPKFNVDVSGNIYYSGNITTGSATDINILDNTANSYRIKEGSNEYLNFTTTNLSETITFGNSLTSITDIVKDNVTNAYVLKEGTSQYIAIDTTNGSELVKFETGNVTITNDLAVNGSDITTTSTGTATLFNTNATTLNVGGAATTVAIGNVGTGARTVNIGTAATGGASTLTFGGAVTGNTVKLGGTTSGTINFTTDVTTGVANIFTSVTGNTNIGGAAATVNVGTTGGNSTLEVRGNAITGTSTIKTNSGVTTANVYNTVVTTGNAFGVATGINLGTSAAALSTLTFGPTITGNIFKIGGTASGTINLTSDVTTGIVNAYTGLTTGTLNLATGGGSTTNIGGAAATVNVGTTGGNSTLEVRGNAITGTSTIQTNSGVTTGNLFNTNITTGNLFGSATDVNIADTGTSARTIDIATNATGGASTLTFGGAVTGNTFEINSVAAGTVTIGSDVTTGTVNLFTGVTTGTVNIATGGASTANFGGTGGDSTVNIRGNGTSGTATLGTNVTTGIANVFNTVSGTINYGTSNTTHDFGSINIKGNIITTDVVGATQLIIDPFPTGGDSAGEVVIRGNLTVAGTTTTVNSTEMSVNDPIFTIGDSVSTKMVIANASSAATSLIIDNPVGIVETSSITGTNIAGGTTVTNVRTRFYTSAQMAGTQTNSTAIYVYNTSTTLYELIGTWVSEGTNYLEIDLNPNISIREDEYYVGLQLRDANTGTPNSVTIARDPANNKVFTTGATLTLSAGLLSGITAPQEVTISQGADDNMDRGIQFKYYNSTLKSGFFGYDESGISEDVVNYYFTYIPDSTNTNNVFTGAVGSAYFKTVKIDDGVTNGIAYYDTYKRLTRTVAAGTSDATTSYQILTVNASGVPVWTTTVDGGTY